MNFLFKKIKTVIIYIVVAVLLVMIALFPREVEVTYEGIALTPVMKYSYSWKKHKKNIKEFYRSVKDDHTLGPTKFKNVATEQELIRYAPRSIKVVAVAFLLSLILGFLKGIFDFRYRKSKLNIIGNGTTWLVQSIPDFFIVICLQWVILFTMPSVRMFSNHVWYNFIAIGIVVSIYPMMYLARITSAALASEEGQPYIQVARSKGFTEKIVLYKHILRNSMQTILIHFTPLMVYVISSLLVTEYLVGYQGLAYRMFVAIGTLEGLGIGMAPNYEPGIVIGTGLIFTSLVIFAQLTGYIIKRSLRLQ
ncbi:MAG TPA: ABC transporter permease subunit [Bacillaceae bacterium]